MTSYYGWFRPCMEWKFSLPLHLKCFLIYLCAEAESIIETTEILNSAWRCEQDGLENIIHKKNGFLVILFYFYMELWFCNFKELQFVSQPELYFRRIHTSAAIWNTFSHIKGHKIFMLSNTYAHSPV